MAATTRSAPATVLSPPTLFSMAPLNIGEEEADIEGEVLLIGPVMEDEGVGMLPMPPILDPTYPNQSISHAN